MQWPDFFPGASAYQPTTEQLPTMQPIQELISKIRWDPVYAECEIEIGFLDKLAHREIRIPFKNIQFVPGDHFFFHYADSQGEAHQVPLHRIKSVYQDGRLIWHREH